MVTADELLSLDHDRAVGAFEHPRLQLQAWWETAQGPPRREVARRLAALLLQAGDATASFKVAFRWLEEERNAEEHDGAALHAAACAASAAAAEGGRIATGMALLSEVEAEEDLAALLVVDDLGPTRLSTLLALQRAEVRRRSGNPRAALLELFTLMKEQGRDDEAVVEATSRRIAVAVEELTPLFGPLTLQALPDASEVLGFDSPRWALRWKAARAWGIAARGGDPLPLLEEDDPELEDDPLLPLVDPGSLRALARLDELRLRLGVDEDAGARALQWRSELLRAWPLDVDNGLAWAALQVAAGDPEAATALLNRVATGAWISPLQREELKRLRQELAG